MAQVPAQTLDALVATVKVGDTVWVTDDRNRETKGRILDLSFSALLLDTNKGRQEVPATTIAKVRRQHRDPLWNGALIGGLVAVVPIAVWFAPMTESGETASENVGFIALMVGIGAGAGAGIDALKQGRKTIYVAPSRPPATVRLSPMLSPKVKGVRVSVLF